MVTGPLLVARCPLLVVSWDADERRSSQIIISRPLPSGSLEPQGTQSKTPQGNGSKSGWGGPYVKNKPFDFTQGHEPRRMASVFFPQSPSLPPILGAPFRDDFVHDRGAQTLTADDRRRKQTGFRDKQDGSKDPLSAGAKWGTSMNI